MVDPIVDNYSWMHVPLAGASKGVMIGIEGLNIGPQLHPRKIDSAWSIRVNLDSRILAAEARDFVEYVCTYFGYPNQHDRGS